MRSLSAAIREAAEEQDPATQLAEACATKGKEIEAQDREALDPEVQGTTA